MKRKLLVLCIVSCGFRIAVIRYALPYPIYPWSPANWSLLSSWPPDSLNRFIASAINLLRIQDDMNLRWYGQTGEFSDKQGLIQGADSGPSSWLWFDETLMAWLARHSTWTKLRKVSLTGTTLYLQLDRHTTFEKARKTWQFVLTAEWSSQSHLASLCQSLLEERRGFFHADKIVHRRWISAITCNNWDMRFTEVGVAASIAKRNVTGADKLLARSKEDYSGDW